MTALFLAAAAFTLLQSGAGTVRSDFLSLLDRPRVGLAPEVHEVRETDGFRRERIAFASEAGERVPALVVRSSTRSGPSPAVVVLHGTGGTKEGGLSWLEELAAKGFVAIAIDGRHHGGRSRAGKGSAEYVAAILEAYRSGRGRPFLYDTVWDVMRTLDYLETREDVDPRRIGVMGTSKGGMETYLAAAADPRIAAAVPLIGVQSFRWALDHDAWRSRVETFRAALDAAARDAAATIDASFVRKFYDRVVPGIYAAFDGPSMLPLVAPRPLLVINGDSDARTPLDAVRECAAAAERAYAAAGARERFELRLQTNTAHRVTPEARAWTIDWFVRWLKP